MVIITIIPSLCIRWVASTDYTKDAHVSEGILKSLSESYRKVRNCSRFMLGNLDGFDPAIAMVPYCDLSPSDQYMLHRLAVWQGEVDAHYAAYAFSKVIASVNTLVAKDLSAFYFEISKDRLYADAPSSTSRRGAQTVLHHVLCGLSTGIAPILCHLGEDIASHQPGIRPDSSIFTQGWLATSGPTYDTWLGASREGSCLVGSPLLYWEGLLALRGEVNRALEKARSDKLLPSSSAARLILSGPGAYKVLEEASLGKEELAQLFLTAEVELEAEASSSPGECLLEHTGTLEGGEKEVTIGVYHTTMTKCARCWRFAVPAGASEGTDVCTRCALVLEGQ